MPKNGHSPHRFSGMMGEYDMAQINIREIVLDILLELSGQTEYSNVLIGAALDK